MILKQMEKYNDSIIDSISVKGVTTLLNTSFNLTISSCIVCHVGSKGKLKWSITS